MCSQGVGLPLQSIKEEEVAEDIPSPSQSSPALRGRTKQQQQHPHPSKRARRSKTPSASVSTSGESESPVYNNYKWLGTSLESVVEDRLAPFCDNAAAVQPSEEDKLRMDGIKGIAFLLDILKAHKRAKTAEAAASAAAADTEGGEKQN